MKETNIKNKQLQKNYIKREKKVWGEKMPLKSQAVIYNNTSLQQDKQNWNKQTNKQKKKHDGDR